MTEATSEQLGAILDDEELVSALSSHNVVDLFQKMLKKFIVCARKKTLFYSLDHERLDPELLSRYLLRLVNDKVKDSKAVWPKFLDFLNRIGEREISDKLKKMSAPIQHQSACQAGKEDDIIFHHADINFLVKLLVTIVYKYEIVGIALNVPKHRIEECRGTNNVFNMCNILTCWISEDKHTPPSTTLSKLREALSGDLVAEYQLAIDVENQVKQARRSEQKVSSIKCTNDSNPLFDIIEQSIDTEVEDGKSTLLYVLASPRESVCYQWHKNGQPLTNNSTYSGVDEDILVISPAVQGTEGEYTCCVSLQDKQIISNEINLKVLYSQEKKRLLDLYSVQSEVPEDSWPPVCTETFVNLVLIKSEQQHTDAEDYCIAGDADKAAIVKENVTYEDIFGECQSGSLIVIEGRPGSGKTTLVHKLVKDWSNGTILRNAKLVFLITLKSLNNSYSESQPIYLYLEDFIKMNKTNGEGACVILDGLDEYLSEDKSSVIYRMLNKVILPKAMIIVSSRPAAVKDIERNAITKTVQTFGFNKEQILDYIKAFPFNAGYAESENISYASNLEKYLNNHPYVFHMCYLPVHAAMICYLYKHKGDNIPKTQTKIYEEFTLSMILRHLKRYSNETKLNSLDELRGAYKHDFDKLCNIAFTMSTKQVQVITKDELKDLLSYDVGSGDTWCLGLLTVHHTFKFHGEFKEYTFLHLTFQEFLTAYYIARLEKEDQLAVITSNAKLSSVTWMFFCGLINFQHNEDTLKILLKYLDKYIIWRLAGAFESQQKIVCDAVLRELGGKLPFPQQIMSFDINCINYVTSKTSEAITALDLPKNNTVKLLQNIDKKHFKILKKLKIYECLSDTEGWTIVGGMLKQCTQLQEIIGLNLTGDFPEGAEHISEAFKKMNLKFLSMSCSSSSESILMLLTGLKDHKNLQLDLKLNELCPKGIEGLVAGLNKISSYQLCKLVIKNCEITFASALGLTAILQNCNTITQLVLSDDDIDSGSISTLGSSLSNLAHLVYLNLSKDRISDEGAVHLVAGMTGLVSLDYLDLSHNCIGPEGAAAIGKILPNLTALTTIDLSYNNIRPIGACKLAAGLKHGSLLSNLDLSSNSIGCDGASAIFTELHHLTKLEHLSLSDNSISYFHENMKQGLCHLASIKHLYLPIDGIDRDEILYLLQVLKDRGKICESSKILMFYIFRKNAIVITGLDFLGDASSIAYFVDIVLHKSRNIVFKSEQATHNMITVKAKK